MNNSSHGKPTTEEVIEWVESRQKDYKVQRNGRVQMDECPICGSDTGFSIVVVPSDHNEPGMWSCMSDKHPGADAGAFRPLLRQLETGDTAAPLKRKPRAQRSVSVEKPPAQRDAMQDLRAALLANDEVLGWVHRHWGWTPDMIEKMDVGFTDRPSRTDVKTHDDVKMPGVAIDSWIMFPHRWHDGDVIRYVRRLAYPYTEQYKRVFKNYPPGINDRLVCFGMDDIQRWLDDPDLDAKIVVVEGEPDACTLKGLFGDDIYVCAMPGAKRLCDSAVQMILSAPSHPEGVPRVVVIPDLNDDGEGLLEEMVRRMGARRLSAVRVPKGTGIKDITDWCKSVGMDVQRIMDLLLNPEPVESDGFVSTAKHAIHMATRKVDQSYGFAFGVPELDGLVACRNYDSPHLYAGKLSVLIGASGHRKTTLAGRAAVTSAIRGVPGMVSCLEMDKDGLTETLFKGYYGREPLNGDEFGNFGRLIANTGLWMQCSDEDRLYNLESYKELVVEGVESLGIRWIVFDSLSAIPTSDDDGGGSATRWAAAFKSLASKYGLHIMMLGHHTREPGNYDYMKPIHHNSIRRYKDVIQKADIAFCLQSIDRADQAEAISNEALMRVGKSRVSMTGRRADVYWENGLELTIRPGCFDQAVARIQSGSGWGGD